MTKIADLKKRLMGNPAFKTEYENADAQFALIEALVLAGVRVEPHRPQISS